MRLMFAAFVVIAVAGYVANSRPSVTRETLRLAGPGATVCDGWDCLRRERAQGKAAYRFEQHPRLGLIGDVVVNRQMWHVYQWNRRWPWAGLRIERDSH